MRRRPLHRTLLVVHLLILTYGPSASYAPDIAVAEREIARLCNRRKPTSGTNNVGEIMTKPTISEITMWDTHNYVDFNDTDSQSDSFNGYCLRIKQTIEWIERDGGNVIVVRFGNDFDCTKYRKRLAAICTRCLYSCQEQRENVQTSGGEVWTNFRFVLTKESNSRAAESGDLRTAVPR